MERISNGPLGIIATYCPEEFKGVSKRLEGMQYTYVLKLIEKLERENLDQFAYLNGFRDFSVREEQNGPSLVRYVFKKIFTDVKYFVSISHEGRCLKDEVYNLLGRSDTSAILNEIKKELQDESLGIVAGVLRGAPHNLPIPQGNSAEIRAWFENEANQQMLLAIEELYLCERELRCLPDEIVNLQNLEILFLSSNQITALPDWIGNLGNLQEVRLGDNQLAGLPDSIGSLENLRNLDLDNNQLTGLPDSIGNLRNLQALRLRNNQIKGLPDWIGNLENLQEILT